MSGSSATVHQIGLKLAASYKFAESHRHEHRLDLRPFDDQSQTRVRLEAEAVLSILEMADQQKLKVLGSDVIDDELSQNPDNERRGRVELLFSIVSSHVSLTTAIERRQWNCRSGVSLRSTRSIWLQQKVRRRIAF